jgi:hypothetical protein
LDRITEVFQQVTGEGGSVHFLSDEDVAEALVQNQRYKLDRTNQARVCGDYEKTEELVGCLTQYFGKVSREGPTKKQRRSGGSATDLLNRVHLIGSSSLKEARQDSDEDR